MSRFAVALIWTIRASFWLAILAFVVIRSLIDLSIYDEGLAVVGATRILQGETPYHDFWTLYPPGQFWLIAGSFRLFGISLFVVRMLFVITVMALLSALYFLTRRYAGEWMSSCSVLAFLLLQGMQPGQPMPTGLLLSAATLLALFQSLQTDRLRWSLLTGLLAGLTTIFRHDYGAYVLCACSVGFLMRLIRRESSLMRLLLDGLALTAGWISVVVIAGFVLLRQASIQEITDCLVHFPLNVYPQVRSKSMPNLFVFLHLSLPGVGFPGWALWSRACGEIFLYWLAPCVLMIQLLVLLFRPLGRVQKDWTPRDTARLALLIAGILFFNPARIRADIEHLTPGLFFVCILTVDCFVRLFRSSSPLIAKTLASVVGAALIVPVLITGAYEKQAVLTDWLNTSGYMDLGLPRAKGIRVSTQRGDYLRSLEFVRANTQANEPIFVGNSRHDWAFISDPMFYFLSERPSATKYHELHPGLTTTAQVQREIIRELKSRKVRFIVLRNVEADSLPFLPKGIVDSTLLDDYIRENFRVADKFISYQVLKRKDVP